MNVMDQSFTLFPELPPELRQEIWRISLTQEWEYSSFKRVGRQVKLVGRINQSVPKACREARDIMKSALTEVEAKWSTKYHHGGLFHGWINFDRHLFFLRDTEANFHLMKDILEKGMLERIQHIVINPHGYWHLFMTVRALQKWCKIGRAHV